MTIVTNVGRPLLRPGISPPTPRAGARLHYTLVNVSGERVERLTLSGAEAYLGDARAVLDDAGEHSIDLAPNEGLEESLYAVELRDGRDRERWLIYVPDSAEPLQLWDLVDAGRPLTDEQTQRLDVHLNDDQRHLSTPERAALSAANAPAADNPLMTLADAGEGPAGPPGADGDSAYQVWLDAGHSGSEQDYLDALTGERGIAGSDGADGADGPPGPNAVSADAGNLAALGSDSLISVPTAAVAAAAPVQGADPRLSDARVPVADAQFDGYRVPVLAVTPVGGEVVLALDGRVRALTLDADAQLNVTEPAEGASALLLWVLQDATGGHALSLPADWLWMGGTAAGVETTPDGLTLLSAINHPVLHKIVASVQPLAALA